MKSFRSATVRTVLSLALPLALAGCAGSPASPDAATTHPANAHAAASPVPPFQPGLLAITNMVTVRPVAESAPEGHHGDDQHGSKPRTEEKK